MDVPDKVREALAERYTIERELGRGGMGVVYLARDLRYDRPVALKILLPELTARSAPERFQREIHFAARLQHPHILTVLDSGSAGELWYTMPFVEGESLRERLRRERRLPVEDALRITTEAARALDYAHQQGVIHRDVKPENILLTRDGTTLVADFGIARATGVDEGITRSGSPIGTPAYMSPEQIDEEEIDARIGPVCPRGDALRDAGRRAAVRRPERARDRGPAAEPSHAQRAGPPAGCSDRGGRGDSESHGAGAGRALRRGSAVRAGAERVRGEHDVDRLRPDDGRHGPRRGPATPSARGSADRRGRAPHRRRRAVRSPTTPRGQPAADSGTRVVAVLPFDNLGDSADAYFADGVADEIRTKLAQVAGLEVIARGSSLEYRRSAARPAADRPRARGRLPVDRHGPLGEGRRGSRVA